MGSSSLWARLKGRWWPGDDLRRADHNPYGSATAGTSTAGKRGGDDVANGGPIRPGPGGSGVAGHGPLDAAYSLKPRRVPGPLKDILELSFLSGLQDQRAVLHHERKLQARGMNAIAGNNRPMPAAATSDTTAQTSTATEDDQAIHNRCQWVNHNYYQDAPRTETDSENKTRPVIEPQPQPRPARGNRGWLVPLLLTLLLLALLGGGLLVLYLSWPRPGVITPSVNPTPTPVVIQPGEGANTTIKLQDAP